MRRTVKKLGPREPSMEAREEHEKTHLPYSKLVPTLRERARQGGGLQRSPEGS